MTEKTPSHKSSSPDSSRALNKANESERSPSVESNDIPETTPERSTQEVKPPEYPDFAHLNETKVEDIKNPDDHIPYEEEIKRVDGRIEDIDIRLEKLEREAEERKEGLKNVRESLGSNQSEQDPVPPEEEEINRLRQERQNLEERKEEAESVKSLEEVLMDLNEMREKDPATLKIIFDTGRMPNGEPLETKDGKPIKEDVAKTLAEYAEDGITKITVAILKTFLALVNGIIKGIIEVLQNKK